MATRQLRYNQDPILRKRCKEVKEVDDRIRLLLDDMLDTLHHTENGAALAANQVGILKRLVVIDYYDNLLKLVNPHNGKQRNTDMRGRLPQFPGSLCENNPASKGYGKGIK